MEPILPRLKTHPIRDSLTTHRRHGVDTTMITDSATLAAGGEPFHRDPLMSK